MSGNLEFVGRILDNVHGFIYYTDAEKAIIDTLLFKRLQSIKQLSIANWVFPGSEHTRYIHSLGVMYIADKIAIKLNLSTQERKIIRLAGLLHDIGHYPLSHVCELPYKKSLESFPDECFCQKNNERVKSIIDSLCEDINSQYMESSDGYHHEKIGSYIVKNNKNIRDIVIKECGKDAPEIISDIITGNIDRENINPLLVQILHSELDADGIDYLMRDALFSGTGFGVFELNQLIECMEVGEYNGKKILCINPKGIAAADQYLINKFFSYSQVVFNKHICVTEFMAEQIVNWMQKNNAFFPKAQILEEWVKSEKISDQYIAFTDNFFWASLQNILDNPLSDTEPTFIKYFCKMLLNHTELPYEKNSEVKIISKEINEIKDLFLKTDTYKRIDKYKSKIALLERRCMCKQVPQDVFEATLNKIIDNGNQHPEDKDVVSSEDLPNLRARRYMECICVKEDNNELKLLCDDNRSLMRQLYNEQLFILRVFDCSGMGITQN